jgi:hypothetical protein
VKRNAAAAGVPDTISCAVIGAGLKGEIGVSARPRSPHSVRSKTNICTVIQEQVELGIEPVFWQSNADALPPASVGVLTSPVLSSIIATALYPAFR